MISDKRIIFLDYLRVFAFISVLVGHKFYQDVSYYINFLPSFHITQIYLKDFILQAFYGGGAGVFCFFMISGYIIMYVVLIESPFSFILKRFFRIYPLLFCAIIIEAYLWLSFNNTPIDFKTLALQISLFGDFFNTPHSLLGVEWTLRIEIMFYFYMFFLTLFKIQNNIKLLLVIYIVTILIINYLAPFPSGLVIGYFSIHFPFLILGTIYYLYEIRKINLVVLLLFIIFIFYNYFNQILFFQPGSLSANYGFVGFVIFSLFWVIRNNFKNIQINKYIILISSLTYSVYLFHNFLWFFIGHYFNTQNKFYILIILTQLSHIKPNCFLV